MERMGLKSFESNLHRNDLVVISRIIQMIELDTFWHLKTFDAVLTILWRRWDEVIQKQKDESTHCTENSRINKEIDGKEAIDLCSQTQTTTRELHDGVDSTKQEGQDKMKSETIARLEGKTRPEKDIQMA